MNIVVELEDGRTFDVNANPKTFNGLASRVQFERRFGTHPAVMAAWQALFDDEGNAKDGADVSVMREEYLAFLVWLEVRRRAENVPEFEEFIGFVVDMTLDMGADENPTTPPPSET